MCLLALTFNRIKLPEYCVRVLFVLRKTIQLFHLLESHLLHGKLTKPITGWNQVCVGTGRAI